MGRRAELRGDGQGQRVRSAAALLEAIGGSVEVRQGPDGWELQANGCPLSAVVAEDPEACALAEALVAEVTGMQVTEHCQKTARPQCAFHVQTGSEAGAEGSSVE